MSNGFFIPEEIFNDDRLSCAEKMILAKYWWFTENGELHECCKTNECIACEIGVSKDTVKRARNLFKKLGLIESNGTSVKYTGGQNAPVEEVQNAPAGAKCTPDRGKMHPQEVQNDPCNNNIIKDNKEGMKEETDTPRERNRKFDVQLKQLQACIVELESIRVMPQGEKRVKAQKELMKRAKTALNEGKKHATEKQTGLILSQYDKFAKAFVSLLPYVPRTNND